jgi:hypothetical protein
MKRRLRILLTLASVLALVMVMSVGTASAHPNASDETQFAGAGNSSPTLNDCDAGNNIDPVYCGGAFGHMNPNGEAGALRGFVNHSPMCTEHYYVSLGGQDHGNE